MTVMKVEDFAKFLRKLAEAVETGDSFEGNLQYTFGDEPGLMNIEAALRTGNREGQGGMLLL
jgi:hypothetical protein